MSFADDCIRFVLLRLQYSCVGILALLRYRYFTVKGISEKWSRAIQRLGINIGSNPGTQWPDQSVFGDGKAVQKLCSLLLNNGKAEESRMPEGEIWK